MKGKLIIILMSLGHYYGIREEGNKVDFHGAFCLRGFSVIEKQVVH